MSSNDARREALHRAYGVVGADLERLRCVLEVPRKALSDWLAGRAEVPLPIFLRAVDVIFEADSRGEQVPPQGSAPIAAAKAGARRAASGIEAG